MKKLDTFFKFRGEDHNIIADIEGPDESVGIMGVAITSITVLDMEGTIVDITLAEHDALCENEELLEKASSAYHYDPEEP